MEQLLYKLSLIAALSEGLEKRLRAIIKPLNFKAGQKILVPGEVCSRIYFVERGLIRIFHMLGKNEISDWFITDMDICISVGSFLEQIPSREFHIALEDCVCWGISYEELEETYRLYPEFNLHGRKIETEYYVKLDTRTSLLKRQRADFKYENILRTNPGFLTRITIKDMASYLDISETTFKRYKNLYIKKKAREAARKNTHKL
jgi:CRP-like cAMP-binding protein